MNTPTASIHCKTSFQFIDSKTLNGRTARNLEAMRASSLSEQGVYVCTSNPYQLNAKLPLRIHLLDKSISADAVVIYNDRVSGDRREPGMGLQFVKISQQDREHIRKFIRTEIARETDSQ